MSPLANTDTLHTCVSCGLGMGDDSLVCVGCVRALPDELGMRHMGPETLRARLERHALVVDEAIRTLRESRDPDAMIDLFRLRVAKHSDGDKPAGGAS
ncbi:MAG TPA: hypothetical protein VFB62_01720 [Polyangiaceae bacterium]|nr:hypothetical protein [Polyangiaceae bacterium]